MLNINEIHQYIDEIMPFDTQEKWDNSGLLIESGRAVDKLLVCLDVTAGAVETAVRTSCQGILSHHPIIFSPILKIEKDSVITTIIKNDISVISAHTNFDKYRYGTCYSLMQYIGLKGEVEFDEIGLTVELAAPISFSSILAEIKQKVNFTIKYTVGNIEIKKIFLLAGSGNGMLDKIFKTGASCVITGEMGYHDRLDLKAKGISVICLGHDLSEQISIQPLCDIVKKQFKNIEVIPFIEKPIEEFY